MESFRWFSSAGDWEKHFSNFERQLVLFVGPVVMYFIGKKLKSKYGLDRDVRKSLYNSCDTWTKAIKKVKQKRKENYF